jgi:hypothetical protein
MRKWNRYAMLAAGLAAVPASAQAPSTTPWLYQQDASTNNRVLAFVQASDGTQFILKCDEPGKRNVYGMISADSKLGRPGPQPITRTITYRFDGGRPNKDNWRYYETTAVAFNTSRERQLPKLLELMKDAKQMEVRLEPIDGTPLTTSFEIAGTADAVARVYESCEDDSNPLK